MQYINVNNKNLLGEKNLLHSNTFSERDVRNAGSGIFFFFFYNEAELEACLLSLTGYKYIFYVTNSTSLGFNDD